MSDSFTVLSKGITYTSVKDEHELVAIENKKVTVGNIGKIVSGDINSQAIDFTIPRYYDGVDLLNKKFTIIYENKGGVFTSEAINIMYNKENIRFTWLLDEKATLYSGDLQAAVKVTGTDEKNKTYIFKTEKFTIKIDESVNEYGVEGVYQAWVTEVDTKLSNLESAVSEGTDTFIGTMTEFKEASSSGKIKDGTIVIIVSTD